MIVSTTVGESVGCAILTGQWMGFDHPVGLANHSESAILRAARPQNRIHRHSRIGSYHAILC